MHRQYRDLKVDKKRGAFCFRLVYPIHNFMMNARSAISLGIMLKVVCITYGRQGIEVYKVLTSLGAWVLVLA